VRILQSLTNTETHFDWEPQRRNKRRKDQRVVIIWHRHFETQYVQSWNVVYDKQHQCSVWQLCSNTVFLAMRNNKDDNMTLTITKSPRLLVLLTRLCHKSKKHNYPYAHYHKRTAWGCSPTLENWLLFRQKFSTFGPVVPNLFSVTTLMTNCLKTVDIFNKIS